MFKFNYNPIKKSLNASDIKLVAIITMLIDHIGALIINRIMFFQDFGTPAYKALDFLHQLCRTIGRMAFPIFAFFIAIGFVHTKNKWKYFLRLLLFGLVSELPFNLAVSGRLLYSSYQNVYFTLALGLLAIIGRDYFKKKEIGYGVGSILLKYLSFFLFGVFSVYLLLSTFVGSILLKYRVVPYSLLTASHFSGYTVDLLSPTFIVFALVFGVLSIIVFTFVTVKMDQKKVISEALSWFPTFFCIILVQLLKSDYTGKGILLIVVTYAFLDATKYNNDSMLAGVIAISICSPSELTALLDLFLVDKYNGEKGNMNKYLFYFFYPVHLLIIGLIAKIFLIP
ncbi:MAG: conjugal transfer protein TraX [Lachnospiraceae bacterium]|nr:conjugal transfer protein TraX [Lachnospiraceae bacterium]